MWLLGHAGALLLLMTQGAALYTVSKSSDPHSGQGIRLSVLSDIDADILNSLSH
jgi:hypothetical protein